MLLEPSSGCRGCKGGRSARVRAKARAVWQCAVLEPEPQVPSTLWYRGSDWRRETPAEARGTRLRAPGFAHGGHAPPSPPAHARARGAAPGARAVAKRKALRPKGLVAVYPRVRALPREHHEVGWPVRHRRAPRVSSSECKSGSKLQKRGAELNGDSHCSQNK